MGYEQQDRRFGRDRDQYGSRGQGGDRYRNRDNDRGYRSSEYGSDRGADREYGYRDRDSERSFGSRPSGYDYDDRGFLDRAGDELRSWFGDEEAERRRRWDEREAQREYERRYGRNADRGGYPSAAYGGFAGMGAADVFNPAAAYYPPYTGGTYRENSVRQSSSDRHHDDSYRSWRDRQMESYDRDYADYRRENQSKFDTEFGSWRNTRQGQREHMRRAREHQEVVGSDGQHVGTVDKVHDDRILLTKNDQDAGGRHHSIPVSWIVKVDDKVEISKTADEAQHAWKDEENSLYKWGHDNDRNEDGSRGPHVLNRSFTGTY